MNDVFRIHVLSKTFDANRAPFFGAPPPGGGAPQPGGGPPPGAPPGAPGAPPPGGAPPPAGPGAPPPAGPGDGGGGDGGGDDGGGDGGTPMFDLFGDDGGGGYGQPPAERVPTTPQPRLGIVIQRSPQPGGDLAPQIYSLPDGTTPPATARQAHTPPTPPLPRGHQPIDQPPPRNLRNRMREIQGY